MVTSHVKFANFIYIYNISKALLLIKVTEEGIKMWIEQFLDKIIAILTSIQKLIV